MSTCFIETSSRRNSNDEGPSWFTFSGLVELLRARDEPVHWIDPDERANYPESPASAIASCEASMRRTITVLADPLGGCRIDGTRFITPTDDLVSAAWARREAEELRRQEEFKRQQKEGMDFVYE